MHLPTRADFPNRGRHADSLRPGALSMLALLLVLIASAVPHFSSVASASPHTSVCGSRLATSQFIEPPDVEVWKLPTNADGDHELILAVHSDRTHFCYSYFMNGAMHMAAPTIRVRPGERFALRLVNDIAGPSKGELASSKELSPCSPMPMPMSMSDTPVTRYVGYLNHMIDDRYMSVKPVDTNIHLHGFQGPADQENIFLSTLSTPQHACEYHITIPRTQPPGTYFYHPHVHGASDLQVASGLTGVWIVEPSAPQIARSAEHVVVLRYRLPFKNDNAFAPDPTPLFVAGAEHEATLEPAKQATYDPFAPPPWPLSFPVRGGGISLDPAGCDGLMSESVVGVNGLEAPASLDVPGGQAQLLRILNATSDSPKQLELHDAAGQVVPLRVLELDGVPISGDMAHPIASYTSTNRLMLPSGSRVSILLTAASGQSLTLASTHYCAGAASFFQTPHDLLYVRGTAPSAADPPLAFAPAEASIAEAPAAKLVAYARAHPSAIRRRAITFTEYSLPKHGKIPPHPGYYITDTTNPNFHEHPYWPVFVPGSSVPSNADIVVRAGTIEEWYLFNTTMEPHVFHIHQMSFVVENAPADTPSTSDTIFVPVGKLLPNPRDPDYPLVRPMLVKTLLDFRHVPRGTFVFHCHLLFHEDNGMMAIIRVV